ncbi:Mitochodrial transcription termination factor-related [Cinnamomum micranthum f. kanehirae]|uniref:Mitochodrial transcription termination factor-related n=1 Tax=Cinnamomum micranthum f. kanehirae TaxID=337451 RepID=A0A443NBB3_9MAGN|nr:Mitochodrial transcription termination factor-related [Cinnamomum micranthum f. kanehirae]
MFQFLHKKLLQITHSKNPSTYFHLLPNPYPKSLFYSSTPTCTPSPILSFLINSCGLNQESALSVVKKAPLKTIEKADSVLSFFRAHGFSETQISTLITRYPKLLLSKVDKTLKPKFQFLLGLGLPCSHIARLITSHPYILSRSLKKQIIPAYHQFKSLVGSDENVVRAIKSTLCVLTFDYQKRIISNVSILMKHKVPHSRIVKLVVGNPRALKGKSLRFSGIVKAVEGMGFDPSGSGFAKAVLAFTMMSKSGWEGKMEVYRRLGWSDSEILAAFKKQPMCMISSEKKIRKGMDYFVNEMGMTPSVISQCPNIILHSLEKRVIPRHFVRQVLTSRNLVSENYSISVMMIMSEKNFLDRFVTKYEEQVPELLMDYRSRMQLAR